MVNNKNIEAFINYNYIPFSKSQCLKRLIFIWAISILLCFIGYFNILWIIFLVIFNLVISVLFLTIIIKFSSSKNSRFLCDGFFWLYTSMLINLVSYRLMTLLIGENPLLLIILLLLLLVCIFIFSLVVLSNIKADNYNIATVNNKTSLLPFLGGLFGTLVARIFLQGQSEQAGVSILAFALLILSFIISIPSINLLKVFLYKRVNKDNTGDGSVHNTGHNTEDGSNTGDGSVC